MNRFSSLGSSNPSDNPQSSGQHPGSLISTLSALPHLTNSIDRPRRYFLPHRYEPKYRYPLIVWLHSDGHNENQISQVMPHISSQNYVGVGIRGSRSVDPVGHRFDWSFNPPAVSRCEDAIFQAIDDASNRYSIHPERVFLAGYGAGGTMARRVSLRHGSAFAGCISLGGRFPSGGGIFSNLAASRTVQHFWAVAIDSAVMSHDEFARDVEMISAARLQMEVRRYTVGDEMVREVLRDVDKWTMQRVTGAAAVATPQEDWSTVAVGFSTN